MFSSMATTIGDKCYISSSQCSIKFLGSQISSTMSVSPTISEIVKSCNFNLKKLSPFRYMLSVKHKLLLVKSFILNKVDYCSILLVNAPMVQVTRLQRLLNKAIRFVYLLKKRDSVSNCIWNFVTSNRGVEGCGFITHSGLIYIALVIY